MNSRVLIVDDDEAMGQMLIRALGGHGIDAEQVQSGAAALERFAASDIDVVITDLRMRGIDGLELCGRIAESRPDVPVIVMTAFGSMELAIEAIRRGAYDFITKPFELERIRITIQRALERRTLDRRVRRLEDTLQATQRLGRLIGSSDAMQAVRDLISRVADATTAVLITGESGTGKELVARELHSRSPRSEQPFVAVNCAAMPAPLLESELFGHVRGAFTDARSDREGMFAAARDGTLLLDEIGELPLELQPKLLRALQERMVRPVGANAEFPIGARVVAATNRNLEEAVRDGRFREDLYYRIQVIEIAVPPLRQRGSDVLILGQRFVEQFAASLGKPVAGITRPAAARLLAYPWPGNVRELQNCMERAVTLTQHDAISIDDLPTRVRDYQRVAPLLPTTPEELVPMEEIERRYILQVLEVCGQNKSHAAKILGLDRKTLHRKLQRFGVAGDED